ncbi:Rossmann-fold NAD(P)-binding domain-containing protein [Aquipluma nitroreducens]|nr:hypothetical protein [Aquipluma nitroreducens]
MKNNIIISVLIAITLSCSESRITSTTSSFPILVLTSDNGSDEYTGEILRAEGFNEFRTDKLSDAKVTLDYLSGFYIVILTEMPLTEQHVEMLDTYVKKGGNLLAFRPDKRISNIFGMTDMGASVSEGYIAIDLNSALGKGITNESIQFHGTADKYELSGAKTIADLFIDAHTKSGSPAVVTNNYGKGHAIAFTYNLPKNIIFTRQGNPEYAGIEKDGIVGLRGMDLFTDGWIDTSKNTLNQADEHMHLLSKCLDYLSVDSRPLPRFWYFPDTLKCLAVLDNDGEDNTEADFEPQFEDVDSMGAKMTIYIYALDKVSKAWVDKWVAKGHEIAAHPNDTEEAENPTWNRMDSILGDIKGQIASKYGLTIRTNVNHWFVWCGRNADGSQNFAAEAILEAKHGIEMDANYAFYDIKSNQPEHYLGSLGTNQGNYIGSGLVMKYADAEGKIVNVYQRYTAVYDQQYNESKDPEGFFNSFKGLMDRSLNNDIYSIISIKSHNNEYYFSKKPLMKMLAYANEKGIPVWTALNLLNFLKMKDEASFSNLVWSDNHLSFSLNSSLKHSNGLTFIVPAMSGGLNVKTITTDGVETPIILKSVKGSEYAFVTVTGGSNFEIDVKYGGL